MTPQEAIKRLMSMYKSNDHFMNGRKIEIETAIMAVDKQTPKKMISATKNGDKIGGYCPTCKGTVEVEKSFVREVKGIHCSWCGQKIDYQALDWSDV